MRAACQLWLLCALPSCFVISGDDLRRHDRKLGKDDPADTDTDTDTDTDADTDTDTDADTDTGALLEPTISAVDARLDIDTITLTVAIDDPDGDIAGGALRISVDGNEPSAYLLEGLGWNGNTAVVVLAELFPCEGFSRTYTFTPIDEAGHEGPSFDVPVTLTGATVPESPDTVLLGVIPFPALLCSSHHNSDYEDLWYLDTTTTGFWQFTLVHTGETDRDLRLYDQSFSFLEETDDISESFVQVVDSGDSYYLSIVQYPYISGDYRVYILEP